MYSFTFDVSIYCRYACVNNLKLCPLLQFIEAHEKAADISELLTQAIQERCNCDFSLERLEDSGLVCTEDLNEIVYQARILSIPQASSHQLVVIVTQIVNTEGQTFVVRGLRLNVVPNCAVMTDSFIEVSCEGYDMSGSGNGVLTPYSELPTLLRCIYNVNNFPSSTRYVRI